MANKQLGVDFDNKTTLSNNDTFSIADSEAGNATKDVTLGNLTAPITLDQGNTRVGINEASPSETLDVVGTSYLGTTVKGGAAANPWTVTSNGSDVFMNAGAASQAVRLRPNGDGSTVGEAEHLATGAHNFKDSSGNTSMSVATSGNVGIGTTSPVSKLDVISTSTSDNTILARGKYGLQIQQDITGGYAFRARQLTGMTANYTAEIAQENAATSNSALQITNEGTGAGLFIDQNGNGKGLSIDSEATTQRAFEITHEGTSVGAFSLYTNSVNTGTDGIVRIYADNASTTNPLVLLINDGTGPTLKANGQINFSSLPTSSAGLSAGDLWNNSGVVNIV